MSSLFTEEILPQFVTPKPISIIEFAEDVCNRPLYPKQRILLKLWFLEELEGWEEDVVTRWEQGEDGIELCPMIRWRINYLRDRGYDHFLEVDMNGGRRSSKGYVTGAGVGKIMYEVAQLPDPGAYYGIDPAKSITFGCVATRFDQARDMQFADIRAWMEQCKPLLPRIPSFGDEMFYITTPAGERRRRELVEAGVKVTSESGRIVCKPLPTAQNAVRGAAAMVYTFDEFAHMMETDGRASGAQCYDAAVPALEQFGKASMFFGNSSPYTQVGQFYKQYQKAIEMDGGVPMNPHMFYIKLPSWALYSDWWIGPPRYKRRWQNTGAIMVSPDWPDDKLIEPERVKKEIAIKREQANPEAFSVERRAEWATVVDAYMNPTAVDRAFSPLVIPSINFERLFEQNRDGYNYAFTYKGHCDPSSTTAGFGFAMGHIEMLPDPHDPDNLCQHVVFDLVKRWNPALFPGHTIAWPKVQMEIADLIQFYRPMEFTFDQYQSAAPIQWLHGELRKRNLTSVRVYEKTATSENNWNRWETTLTAFNIGLVHVPRDCGPESDAPGWGDDSEQASLELKFLQKKNTSGRYPRVDKQDTGRVTTKDIADCIMEVTSFLLGDYIAERTAGLEARIAMGAEQGYQIGGRQPGGPSAGGSPFDEFYAKRSSASMYNPATGGKMRHQRRR